MRISDWSSDVCSSDLCLLSKPVHDAIYSENSVIAAPQGAEVSMIVFNLRCAKDHVFEAWFKDGAAYDRQAKKGQVACPDCGSRKIEKAPMAPRVSSGRAREISADTAAAEIGRAHV